MNKKNSSILISVWVTALFFVMATYFVYTGLQEQYRGIRRFDFADATLDRACSAKEISELAAVDGIRLAGGYSEELKSAKMEDAMVVLHFQDTGINAMREYSDLIRGRFAENDEEIVLSKDLAERYHIELGAEISVDIGRRFVGADELSPTATYTEKERFQKEESHSYRVVGIYDNVYHKYLNLSYALTVPKEGESLSVAFRFDDFKEAYRDRDRIEKDLSERLGTSVKLSFPESLSSYYGVLKTGFEARMPILMKIFLILFAILLFVFFVRNIFRVWGLRKVRELSMYKSVGTTDLQIFLLLMKEAVLISVLPVLVAQPAGFFLADAIYRKMQRMRMADPILSIDFSPLLSLFTVGIALFIVTVAMIAPARAISKLSVIDGIKGNFDSGARKKRRDNDLWKELRINHRHSLRALRYVMAVGTILISCFLITVGISRYYREMYTYRGDYNIHASYHSQSAKLPEVLHEILARLPHEKAYISRSKYFNVDPELPFSAEAKDVGIDKRLEKYLDGADDGRIDGSLIGLEEEELRKIGGKKGEFLLLNRLQEDPSLPASKATYVKYFEDLSELTVYLSGSEPRTTLPIARMISSVGEIEEYLPPMEVQIFTDLETQNKLVEAHERAKTAKNVFELKMRVEDSELSEAKSYVETALRNALVSEDRFRLQTGEERSAMESSDLKLLLFWIAGIGGIIFFLNITNGYSSVHLSLFHRKREIGSLYSCGLEREELRRRYRREFLIEEAKSFGIGIATTFGVMIVIHFFSDTFTVKLLLRYYPWLFFSIFSVLIYGGNLLIYSSALNGVLKQPMVELIRAE